MASRVLIYDVAPKVLHFSFWNVEVFRKKNIVLLLSYNCTFNIFIIDLNHIRFFVLLTRKVWAHRRLNLIIVTNRENVFIFTFNTSKTVLTFIFVLSKQKLIVLILRRFWNFNYFFQKFNLLILFIFLSLCIFHIFKSKFSLTFLSSLIIYKNLICFCLLFCFLWDLIIIWKIL
jgi:hypothetical protein